MMRGKYVIVDNFFAVLFPDGMGHDTIRNMNITSAGFFRIYANEQGKLDVAVYGHSESLGMQSNLGDADKIMVLMQMKGGING